MKYLTSLAKSIAVTSLILSVSHCKTTSNSQLSEISTKSFNGWDILYFAKQFEGNDYICRAVCSKNFNMNNLKSLCRRFPMVVAEEDFKQQKTAVDYLNDIKKSETLERNEEGGGVSSKIDLGFLKSIRNFADKICFAEDVKKETVRPAIVQVSTKADVHQNPKTLEQRTGKIVSVSFSSTGHLLLTGSGKGDGTAVISSAFDGQRVLTVEGKDENSQLYASALSPDGNLVASASFDEGLRLWDAKSGAFKEVLWGHVKDSYINTVEFSRDGKFIVTSGSDNTAIVWDVQAKKMLKRITSHTNILTAAHFSVDGTQVITSGVDTDVRVFDAKTGENLTVVGSAKSAFAANLSPDKSLIVAGDEQGTVNVWNANGNEKVKINAHKGVVLAVSFSPDGKRILTAGTDNLAKIWDAQTGTLLKTLTGHTAAIYAAEFSPDGKKVATGGEDRVAKIWDISDL